MYYRLGTEFTERSGYVSKEDNQHETLLGGSLVPDGRLTLPWPFIVNVDEEEGLEMSDYYPDKHLMTKRLIAALEAAGVDNLQTFPAEITNSETGDVIRDYMVVNVIGLVSAADLAASTTTPLADVKFFHTLVVDEKRANGLLMFRLAESRLDVIVEERVAAAIRAGNFRDVVLEPVTSPDAA